MYPPKAPPPLTDPGSAEALLSLSGALVLCHVSSLNPKEPLRLSPPIPRDPPEPFPLALPMTPGLAVENTAATPSPPS